MATDPPPTRPKDLLGRYGEQLAAEALAAVGLRILDRNWRSPSGEIDIVAADGDVLVVCEVKTRTSTRYGTPLEAVDWRKMRRLHVLGAQWARDHHCSGRPIRVDVVAIVAPRGGAVELQHVRDVA